MALIACDVELERQRLLEVDGDVANEKVARVRFTEGGRDPPNDGMNTRHFLNLRKSQRLDEADYPFLDNNQFHATMSWIAKHTRYHELAYQTEPSLIDRAYHLVETGDRDSPELL